MDQRIAERRAEVRRWRRMRRLRRTLTALALLLVSLALVLVERSSLVALAEIRVDGTRRLTPAEVIDAANLAVGTSLVRLDLAAAERRIEALPLVADALIRRTDPVTVLIEVREHDPELVVVMGDHRILLAADGTFLAPALMADTYLEVFTIGGSAPVAGETTGHHPAVANALAIHQELSGPLLAQVARYLALTADETDLVLDSGIRVRMGRAERLDEKARALGAVLEDIADADVAAIDVRAPAAPVVESAQ